MSVDLRTLFVQLRALFKLHEPRLIVLRDDDLKYMLASHEVRDRDGYRTAFGGVELNRGLCVAAPDADPAAPRAEGRARP